MPDFSTFIVFGDGIRSSSLCLAFHTILDVFGNSRHNIKRSPTCMRLAFRLAGSCSIPWRVDAERADLRLGRRGISIWVDGRRWRGVGAVVQWLAAALSVTRQCRWKFPKRPGRWLPNLSGNRLPLPDFDAGGAARALQNGLQIAEWSAKIHQSFQRLAA